MDDDYCSYVPSPISAQPIQSKKRRKLKGQSNKGGTPSKEDASERPTPSSGSDSPIQGFLKRGTRRVPKTGIYKLHSGEAVLNRRQAKAYRKRAPKRRSK
jgi:hypothetical protein